MKRKLLVLLMAVAMLATILPVNTAMVALGEDEEAPITSQAPAEETPEESEPSSDPEVLPEPEVTNEAPAEEPDEEPAEEPKDEDEPDVDDEPTTDAPVVDEPTTDDPKADEPTEDEPVVDEPVVDEPITDDEPFTATVVIKLENEGDIYFGDLVTLRAEVEAGGDYTVVWEYLEENPEDEDEPIWVALDEGDTYKFIVNEENALLTYRAVVNGEVVSEKFVLPEVKEPEMDETTEEPSEDPEDETTEEPSEEPVVDPEELLDPERSIEIHVEWDGDLYFGDEVTLVAELHGYENTVYTVQWETSKDDVNWTEVEGATELTHMFVVTEENWQDFWRLTVEVTGVIVEEE